MTDHEKKILETLDTATKDIKVPENLMPEKMEEKLKQHRQKRWKRSYTYMMAAACLAVVIGGALIWSMAGQSLKPSDLNTTTGEPEISGQIASAKDYSEVYEYVRTDETQEQLEASSDTGSGDNAVLYDSSETTTESKSNSADMAVPEAAASSGGYSDTNVRTEGVGEADVVKTDGTYLYVLKESAAEISIVDTTKDEMKVVSSVKAPEDGQIAEFYLDGKKLFVLSIVSRESEGDTWWYREDTQLDTYDISDVTSPALSGSVMQSGRYLSSRYSDGYLYTFSNYTVPYDCTENDKGTYIPLVNGEYVAESDILLPPIKEADSYTIVTSVNPEKPSETVDQTAVLSQNGQCYVSGDNIYIYEGRWNSNARGMSFVSNTTTIIRRISYKDGELTGEAQGKVDGYLNDSFSLDEYEGNLRLVTTVETDKITNHVYVLNDKLEIIGKITDLAEDERVYSARFYGDAGYFVTYRQTDPLFSVDFSEPSDPKIIGTLKIPGFSEYLHFYDENLLLGIGMDIDAESGVTNGVKISMFDISDPTDVKEVQKYTIKNAYSSDVFYDYRAVLIDKEKNMIGFSTYGDIDEMYYIFSYDETNGFNQEMEEEVNGTSYMGTRGVYIKDKLYIIKGNAIESYRLDGYVKVDDILL